MSTSRAAKFIGGASEIAHYYGFRALPEVAPEISATKLRSLTASEAAMAAGAKYGGAAADPILSFYAAPGATISHTENVASARESGTFSLQIVGCPTSIGEIHILKTLEAIVAENGASISCARINSLGDKDSRARFVRELGVYLRRHGTEFEPTLTPEERTALYENPLKAYGSKNATLSGLLADAPRSVHFLSEKSRTHFRQVLDHLERVNFPYTIDDLLIHGHVGESSEPRVMFSLELKDGEGMLTASIGGRYDDLATRPGTRGQVPTVHATIEFRTKTALPSASLKSQPIRPKVYFIQFGDSAKLTGFTVIDTLRRARVPVGSQFDARHLAPQLSAAQGLGVPYVLIMGAREALDQTVIVRTLATSAQTTVPICELPKHLRTLKLV